MDQFIIIYRFNWNSLLVLVIILTYSSLLLWLLGNPAMGHPLQLIADNHSGVIFLFGIGAGFSFTLLLRKEDGSFDDFLIGMTFVNGILFTLLLVFIVLGFFSKNYVTLFSIITVCCLTWSIVLHLRSGWNFASAFYALYGFICPCPGSSLGTLICAAFYLFIFGLARIDLIYRVLALLFLAVISIGISMYYTSRIKKSDN